MPPVLVVFVLVAGFGVAALTGAPYVPILGQDRRKLIHLTNLQAGQTIIDLGSGDGRLLRATAAHGLKSIGYEINPILVIISWLVCWKYRRLVTIHWGNMWTAKLPPADIIYVFLLDRYMAKLNGKLTAEISKPTLVVSYVFKIPGRTPIRENATAMVYQYGKKN